MPQELYCRTIGCTTTQSLSYRVYDLVFIIQFTPHNIFLNNVDRDVDFGSTSQDILKHRLSYAKLPSISDIFLPSSKTS